MITNPTYIQNITEIANLFCKDQLNKNLCVSSIQTRLKNVFDDNGFFKFLSKLSFGRAYESEFKNYRTDPNTNRRYIDLFLLDVITGETKKITWNWLMNSDFYIQIKNSLSAYNFEIIQGSPIFDRGNLSYKRILHKSTDPSYGIVFVPGGIPGGEADPPNVKLPGGTPGGQIIPTKQNPIPTPVTSGLNLSTLITPTTALIAAGILAVYLFMKK